MIVMYTSVTSCGKHTQEKYMSIDILQTKATVLWVLPKLLK